MKYRILQAREDVKYVFRGYDFAKKNGFSFCDYNQVWESDIKVDEKSDAGGVAELLFMMFNSDQMPENYQGRSMSVSDIVVVNGQYFYCDNIGFKEIGKNNDIIEILKKYTTIEWQVLQDEHDRDIDFTKINGKVCDWDEYCAVSRWLENDK